MIELPNRNCSIACSFCEQKNPLIFLTLYRETTVIAIILIIDSRSSIAWLPTVPISEGQSHFLRVIVPQARLHKLLYHGNAHTFTPKSFFMEIVLLSSAGWVSGFRCLDSVEWCNSGMIEHFHFACLFVYSIWLSFQFAFLFHLECLPVCLFFVCLILKFQQIKAAAQTFRHVFYRVLLSVMHVGNSCIRVAAKISIMGDENLA